MNVLGGVRNVWGGGLLLGGDLVRWWERGPRGVMGMRVVVWER